MGDTFWVALSFIIFVGLIIRPVSRIILKALDERARNVRSQLAEATRLKEEAQTLLAAFERELEKARKESDDILAHAKAEAEYIKQESEKTLKEAVEKRTELAKQKIAQAEANVLADIQDNAVDLTVSAARTLIMENLKQEQADAIIEHAIDDIDRKLH